MSPTPSRFGGPHKLNVIRITDESLKMVMMCHVHDRMSGRSVFINLMNDTLLILQITYENTVIVSPRSDGLSRTKLLDRTPTHSHNNHTKRFLITQSTFVVFRSPVESCDVHDPQ